MWVWEEVQEEEEGGVEGRWVFRLAGAESSISGSDEDGAPRRDERGMELEVEKVETKEHRVQAVLQALARESIWPAEYLDIVPTVSGKGSKVQKGKSSGNGNGKKEEVLRLEEMDVGGLEDEEGLWGSSGAGGEVGGLFDDERVEEVKQGATVPAAASTRGTKRTAGESVDEASDMAEDEEDVVGLEDDDLFGDVKQTSVSPLFGGNTSLPAVSSTTKRQKKGQALPSDVSNDFTDGGSHSESDAGSASSGLFGDREQVTALISAGKTPSLKQVVKTEKKTGLAVLSALGFDLDEPRSSVPVSKSKAVVLQDESSGEESDWAPAMRLRGGATDAEMESASSSSTSSSSSSDDSSSDSDDSSSSSEEDSSDEEEDEKEDVEMSTENKEMTKQQTLKDMFAPRADEGQSESVSSVNFVSDRIPSSRSRRILPPGRTRPRARF